MLKLAERDLEAAKDNLKLENFDWALSIAYNAMLCAARALMFSKGFRPKGASKHLAAVRFIESPDTKIHPHTASLFNRLRIKRHRAVYDESDGTSFSEAKNAIDFARELVAAVKKQID